MSHILQLLIGQSMCLCCLGKCRDHMRPQTSWSMVGRTAQQVRGRASASKHIALGEACKSSVNRVHRFFTLQFLLMAFHALRMLLNEGMTRDCPKVLTQFGRFELVVIFLCIFERTFLNQLRWTSSTLPSPFQSSCAKIANKQTLKYVIDICGKVGKRSTRASSQSPTF